jgi:hypothetical protein
VLDQQDARERVARGARFLDQHRPGWHAEIDTARLRMESCAQCILGQLFGDFPRALTLTPQRDPEWVREHGFDLAIPEFDSDEHILDGYRRLTEMWIDEIHKRKESAP